MATVEKPRIRNASGQYSARGMITAKLLRTAYGSPRVGKGALPQKPVTFSDDSRIVHFIANDFVADKVDTVNAIIRGVSVITGGLIARGHDLEVDNTTLKQMKLCAEAKGNQIPVKVDHKSGAAAVCGFLSDFRLDGNKLKADWHLLQSHPQKEQILETAQRMPRGVGLSAAFVSPDKAERTESGKNAARCKELISVDYVTLPAANPDGMFSAVVDSPQTAMNPEILAAIKAAVAEAVAPISQTIEAQSKQLSLLTNPPTLEDLAQMSDEELAQFDLTSEDVQAALEEISNEQSETEGQTEQVAEGQAVEGQAEGQTAEASVAGASPAVSAALSALTKQVTELKAQLKAKDEAVELDQADTLFSEVDAKITELSEENARLKSALKNGGSAVSAGVDRNQVRFFSAKRNEGEFENLVQFAIEEKKLPKAKAFEFARKENPAAYNNYLVRLGVAKGDE